MNEVKKNIALSVNANFSFDFNSGKKELFVKGYTLLQIDSINAIFAECVRQGVRARAQIAYILATAYHEGNDYDGKSTGKVQALVPISEKGSESYLRKKPYWPYIGMGFVQLTWLENYKKFQPLLKEKFSVDIIKEPKYLLRIDVSAFVLVYGMMNGMFSGKKLSTYINSGKTDYPGARKVVNGTDKAEHIASIASKFYKCIF